MSLTESQARQSLQNLIADYNRLSEDERKTMTEASVVRQFIDRLLEEVLDWPIKEPARYQYELAAEGGRPDITLTLESGEPVFVEAKKFGILDAAREAGKIVSGFIGPGQVSASGVARGRSEAEKQAINYAYKNKGRFAFLTNFEKLRLFDVQYDRMVLSFERPAAYLDEFEYLRRLSYESIQQGSLEALSAQRIAPDIDNEYLALINSWRVTLAQNLVDRRDRNPWLVLPDGEINVNALRTVVQRLIDRLVVIRFAEDHYVIPSQAIQEISKAYDVNRRYLELAPILRDLFRGFDREHNSTLFARSEVDNAVVDDGVLFDLLRQLYDARYRSMPADIMGNTYEQYLGTTLAIRGGRVAAVDNLETRKKQGSYYTPQVLVRYIVDQSLGLWLYGTENGRPDGAPIPGETRKTSADLATLRILDSACGSGSFLIYAFQVLAEFYRSEIERLTRAAEARIDELAAQGVSPLDIRIDLSELTGERERIGDYPRLILEQHLYGIDLDPQAAEIATVNLMMRALEGIHAEENSDKHLPLLLNQNIKVGNGLVGMRPDDMSRSEWAAPRAAIRKLRAELIATPHGERHDQIIRELAAASAALSAELNAHAGIGYRFSKPDAIRPFHWGVEFPEVFFDENGAPLPDAGFTIIIGNPPWEILKPDLREFYAQFDERIESRFTREQVEKRIVELDAEDPALRAAYDATTRITTETAAYAHDFGQYTRQGRGDTATHKLFLERMFGLLRREGRIGYVVPSGIYKDLGTKELRELLLNEGNIQYLFAFSNVKNFFPGVNDRVQFVLLGAQKGPQSDGFWTVFRFNPRVAVKPEDLPVFVGNRDNLIYMRRDAIQRFSPDSLSVMEFQTPEDYQVAEKIYDNWPLLGDPSGPWTVRLANEFHMTNDRDLLNQQRQGLAVYEGKMIHQFNAFYAEPKFWVEEKAGRTRFLGKGGEFQQIAGYQRFRIGFREIARSTDERTMIAAMLPKDVFCNHKIWTVQTDADPVNLFLLAVLNSLVFDAILRPRVTTTVANFIVREMPVPHLTAGHPTFDAIVPRAARLTCTRHEFAALWKSVMGESWKVGKSATDPAERQVLRDEIDVLVARLYGLDRAEFEHILGTFPLVFPESDEGKAKKAALLATFERELH